MVTAEEKGKGSTLATCLGGVISGERGIDSEEGERIVIMKWHGELDNRELETGWNRTKLTWANRRFTIDYSVTW